MKPVRSCSLTGAAQPQKTVTQIAIITINLKLQFMIFFSRFAGSAKSKRLAKRAEPKIFLGQFEPINSLNKKCKDQADRKRQGQIASRYVTYAPRACFVAKHLHT